MFTMLLILKAPHVDPQEQATNLRVRVIYKGFRNRCDAWMTCSHIRPPAIRRWAMQSLRHAIVWCWTTGGLLSDAKPVCWEWNSINKSTFHHHSCLTVWYKGCRPFYVSRILHVDVACSRTGVPDRFNYGVITKISTKKSLAFAS